MKKRLSTQKFGPGFTVDLDDPGYALPESVIVEKDVPIKMRDGLELASNIYRPNKPGRFPVIMSFTIYGKDLSGWGKGYRIPSHIISKSTAFEAVDPGFWVPYDYVVILVDSRGFGRSPGGAWKGYDYYDAIEWAGVQNWSNGKVGLCGVSYLAIIQWDAAYLRPPHLKAIIPWEADTLQPTPKYGCIPETGFLKKLDALFLAPSHPAWGRSFPDERPSGEHVLEPPLERVLEDINVPALICATWSDQELHTRGGLWAYKTIASNHKWLYTHGRHKWREFYTSEALDIQKKFFDCFLKGSDNRIMLTPRVRLEIRENIHKYLVRYEDDWPLPRTKYKKLYLNAENGILDFHQYSRARKVSYNSSNEKAIFDIRFDEDTELTGHMKLKLWVSPEKANDMDIFVTLKKLDTEGNEVYFDSWHAPSRYPVALGWLRLSWRELDAERSTPWQPLLKCESAHKVKVGDIVPCQIEIYPSSTLFRTGESLRLVISGQYGVESTRYVFDEASVNEGNHIIYTGGKYDSYLLVPIIQSEEIVT